MPKEKKTLTVKEIHQLEPKAEVYELSPYKKYIVIVQKSSIISGDNSAAIRTAKELARIMIAAHIPCQMLVGIDMNEVKFLEIS